MNKLTIDQVEAKVTVAEPKMPDMSRKWWEANRLNIRPVLWSLRNRPQDWTLTAGGLTMNHRPSDHDFWVGNGLWFYGLYEARCSCSTSRSTGRGKFNLIQKIEFRSAYKAWRRWDRQTNEAHRIAQAEAERRQVDQQFAGHFLPKEPTLRTVVRVGGSPVTTY